MSIRQFRTWSVRCLKVAILGGALACTASVAVAQTPTPTARRPATVGRTFTKNTSFNLPIQMAPAACATLSEVRLYVKSGQHPWLLHAAVPPSTAFFTCEAPADGEYQFMLVTVDKSGNRSPNEIEGQPPTLRVVVDTTAPALDVSAIVENGAPYLQVKMIDANPDLSALRAMVTTTEGEQRALSPAAGRPGCFVLSSADLALPVWVAGSDMAGNMATRDVSPRTLIAAAATSSPAVPRPASEKTASPATLPAATAPNVVNTSYLRPGPHVQNETPPQESTESRGPLLPLPAAPARTESAAAAPKRANDETGSSDELKKIAAERDEVRTQLALLVRERDELNAKLKERATEAVDLRVQLGMRVQERQQMTRELQLIEREVRTLLMRLEPDVSPTPPAAAPSSQSTSLSPTPFPPVLPPSGGVGTPRP